MPVAAIRSDSHGAKGPTLASILRAASRFVLIALFASLLTVDNHAISSAHISASVPDSSPVPNHSTSSASSYGSAHPSSKVNVDNARDSTGVTRNNNANSDDNRIHEILTSIYSQMHKYHHHTPSASLTSDPKKSPNLDSHLITEHVQQFLKEVDYSNNNKNQDNVKTNFATNFKTNGKTMNSDDIAKIVVNSGEPVAGHYQQLPLVENGASGTGKLKLSSYTGISGTERVDENRDESPVANKYLSSLGPAVQRKVLGTESKPTAGINVGGTPGGAASAPHPTDSSIYELLMSIDSRVQKLQDNLVYYQRNVPKPPVHSPLNPIFSNYLSLIKAQVLNIESTIEAKFSNIEHKFSNIEIEDGIWKKTINWKLEEVSSKLSQNENKLSFSNEQVMNKLDLFERNFQIVTNDFFSKFLFVNEKLNKIELSLQTKWNDLEAKLRNNFADSYKLLHKTPNAYKPDLAEASHVEHIDKDQNLAQQDHTSKGSPASHSQENISNGARNVIDQLKESVIGSKLNKTSAIKVNNVTNLPDKIKFAQRFDRFLKLMNSKTNQTIHSKNKYNTTSLLDALINNPPATAGPMMNDAPQADHIDNTASVSASQRHVEKSQSEANSTTAKVEKLSQMASENYRLMMAASVPVTATSIGSSSNKSIIQAGVNNRNLDTLNGINYAEFSGVRNTSGDTTREVPLRPKQELSEQNKRPDCEKLVSMVNFEGPTKIQDRQIFMSKCKQMMDGNESNGIHSLTGNTLAANVEDIMHENRESSLEKRELNEEIVVDQAKEGLATPERPSPISDETLTQMNEIKADKLEELDSKLQFFSTKIIKIVQEMWLSTQASENYLKESLVIANKTKNMIEDKFTLLHKALKPMPNLVEEMREPIINRLQELSSAFNNSVEVILNTQAEFIHSCRTTREEDMQIFEVLEYFINETRSKSSIGITQLQQILQDQSSQFNHSIEFLFRKLDGVSKKTIEGVRSETVKLLEMVKGEMHHQISSMNGAVNGGGAQSLLASSGMGEMPRSIGVSHGGSTQCHNECFITKEEFANICINIDGSKMFGAALDTAAADKEPSAATGGLANQSSHQQPMSPSLPGNGQKGVLSDLEPYSNGTRGTATANTIEINNGNNDNN